MNSEIKVKMKLLKIISYFILNSIRNQFLLRSLFLTSIYFISVEYLSAQTRVSDNILSLDEGNKSPIANLENVSWITGYWRGKGLDGECEQIWSSASLSHMIGTFRMIKTKKFKFFAFLDLTEVNGSLALRVKHFGYDLHGWEEKDGYTEFPLVEIADDKIFFDGLTMESKGDKLIIYIMIKYQNGETKEEKYEYKKRNWKDL